MAKKKIRTYMDELLADEDFRKKFEKEYQNVLISERIARLRQSANLTQEALARKIHTTKSAISRYESARYNNYSLTLLRKIASACGAELRVFFVTSGKTTGSRRKIATLKLEGDKKSRSRG